MVSGKGDILQQLACFLHAGVQLIILIVLVELIKAMVKARSMTLSFTILMVFVVLVFVGTWEISMDV